ncbi:MAG: GvpL/GvpF family gas vesicle protein [Pseudomonadota bacterium]
MALFVHGILTALPLEDGVRGDAVCVAGGTLQAICTDRDLALAPLDDAEAEIAAAAAHHDHLVRLCQTRDVLPVRFGTVFSGEAPLRAHLEDNAQSYSKALEHVSGCLEFGFRIAGGQDARVTAPSAAAPPSTETSGRAFLLRRRGHRDRRADLSTRRAAVLRRALRDLETTSRDLSLAQPAAGLLLDASLLVAHPRQDHLRGMARALNGAAGEVGLSVSLLGPWPPYSFCAPPDVLQSDVPPPAEAASERLHA